MTPQEFCKKWNVKRSQLARLLDMNQASIDHWFSPKSPREPQPDALKRLDEYDSILEHRLAFQRFVETTEAYYEEKFPLLNEIFLANFED